MTEEQAAAYECNEGVQRRILAAMVYDGPNSQLYAEVVRPEYFTNRVFQDMAAAVLDFYKRYDRAPQLDELGNEVAALLEEKRSLPADEYVAELEKVAAAGARGSFDYARDEAVKFAKYRAMEVALLASAKILRLANYDKICRLVDEARAIGDRHDGTGTLYLDDTPARIARREAGQNRAALAVPTGIPVVDMHMGGGLMRTELGILMGPMKRGKTIFAINLAKAAMLAGIDVLHIALEGSQLKLEDRYDANISGVSRKELKEKAGDVRAAVEKFKEHPGVGRLVIQHYPAYTATTQIFDGLINRLRAARGIRPGLVIVDYLGLLAVGGGKAVKTYDTGARYNIFGDHTKELIAIAQRHNAAVWLLHQTTRGSITKSTVGLEDSADSIQPLQDADVIVTLNQKASEKKDGIIRLFIAGGRDVEDKKYAACRVDYLTCRVEPLSEEEQGRYSRRQRYDEEKGEYD